MAKDNLTKTANVSVAAREIDFVTRFGDNWEALREIMGIMRPIRKQPGAVLKSKKASITLQSGSVGEGEEIPYSLASVVEVPYAEMSIEKYAKATSIEAIKDHGYDVAIAMTDSAFLSQLQNNVTGRFYDYLVGGTLVGEYSTFQMALAMARGLVLNQFKKMHKDVTEVVGFVNLLDFYAYLGAADITVQTDFGLTYVRNFMGYRVVFLCADSEIAQGKVVAVPVENINMYYVDPGDSDFSRAGLEYTVAGETPLIGFHTQGNYNTAVSECFALMGLTLFAEYLDGIAVITIGSDTPGIAVSPTTKSVVKGAANKFSITATTTPSGAPVSWSTSAAAVATVDAEGEVIPVAAGSATITATAIINGVAKTATCAVTVTNS